MFYLHDFGDYDLECAFDYDLVYYRRWCREAYAALAAHPECTDDPAQSDYSVASATLRCVSFANLKWSQLSHNLGVMLRRNGSKRYVVFDLSDSPRPIFASPQAIVCKSAFHTRFYSPDSSVAMPQFPRHHFIGSCVPASQRPVLAGFKGALRPEHNSVRTELMTLNNQKDVVVTGATLTPKHIRFLASGQSVENTPAGEVSYMALLSASTFALLPRGHGYSLGYRLIESLNAGCVPVILSDGHVLPFSEVLDYSSWSITVPERTVQDLPAMLRERLPDVDRMQSNALRVYHEYFGSTERIIFHTLAIAAQRA